MKGIKAKDKVKILSISHSIPSGEYFIGEICEVKDVKEANEDIDYVYVNTKHGKYWCFLDMELELIKSTESTTKKIKQSLLRLYLSDTNKTIKSEKIIDYVKQEIGTEYKFGDTILRALRQLRQDGKLDYEIDGAKQDRNYKFKAV
jgi:hypothetical protein